MISDNQEIANTFDNFFQEAASSLDIYPFLLNDPGNLEDPVDIALTKFESHPSILAIKNKCSANEGPLGGFLVGGGGLKNGQNGKKKLYI